VDVSLIQRKIVKLTEDFSRELGLELWDSQLLLEVSDIIRPVNTMDGLRSRILDLGNLLDHFNRAAFNAHVRVAASTKSLNSLIAVLKFTFPDNQPQIEHDVERPLRYIRVLRNYFAHGKTRDNAKALEFFDLPDPITDPTIAWEKVLFRFSECLDQIQGLLSVRRGADRSADRYVEASMQDLVDILLNREPELLQSAPVRSLLREVIAHGSIRDTELAATHNLTVDQLRRLLFPLTNGLLIVRPFDRNTTTISVVPQVAGLLAERGPR
jgi:hypothetical protein